MELGLNLKNVEGFEWDNANLDHISRHDINYKECEQVFFNKPFIINNDESHSQVEERYRVYGQTNEKRLITLIFTIRNSSIRVISSRDQSRKEREEFIKKGGGTL